MRIDPILILSDMVPAQEAAQLMACSEQTLRRKIASGELPAFKIKRRLYFRKSDLDALFTAVAASGAAQAQTKPTAARMLAYLREHPELDAERVRG